MKQEKQKVSKTSTVKKEEANLLFEKENYLWMLGGIAIIVIGFMLMSGGGSDDPKIFDESIFSFRRIVLAPIVVVSGFIIEIFAIFRK